MDLITAIPALGTAGAVAATAFKSPELLKEIYGDIAKPGVSQVGKALGTVLGLGNTVLIPLRLLNEVGRAFEHQTFERIAARFSKIPDDKVIPICPEIGVPIMDKLSYTSDDTLRNMFIELLAKAATFDLVNQAHPSFVNLISSICPDEAIIISEFSNKKDIPFLEIRAVNEPSNSYVVLNDLLVNPIDGMRYPDQTPLYISNLAGLGIVEIMRDVFLSDKGSYDSLERYVREKFGYSDSIDISGLSKKIEYRRHIVKMLPYGQAFAGACS